MPRTKSAPARDSRSSRRRQQAEHPRSASETPQSPPAQPYRDDLEEAQRENEDNHVSDK